MKALGGPELLRWQYVDARYDHVVPRITVAAASRLVEGWRSGRVELVTFGRHLVLEPYEAPLAGLRVTDRGAVRDADAGLNGSGGSRPGGAGGAGSAGGPAPLAILRPARRRRRGVAGRLYVQGCLPFDWLVPDSLSSACGFVTRDRNYVLFAHDGTAITGLNGGVEIGGGVSLLGLLLAVGWFQLLLERRAIGLPVLGDRVVPPGRAGAPAEEPGLAAYENWGGSPGHGAPWASPGLSPAGTLPPGTSSQVRVRR